MKALKDQECVLECVVKGTPRPRIVWYKDGQPIMSTDRVMIKQVGFTCRLRISQTDDNDSGRYTCEASNSIGRVSTFARLQVVSDPKIYAADSKLKKYVEMEDEKASEMIPMFTMRLRDRRVQVTYPVRLTCQVVGYPNPTITWSKDGSEIENDGRFLVCDDGQFNTLEISKTTLDDIGTYTATAKNDLGSVSCNCSLIVDKGIRAYIAPDFYMPLDPVYVFKEGQEIRLTAKVEAYPSVGVSWHRNGARLRPSRKILATLNYDGFVELIIAEASVKDAGIYVCSASNPVGKVESTCKVIIEEATEEELRSSKPSVLRGSDKPYSKEPMFVKKPRSSEAYEGDTVILSCEVVGDPIPDVVWLRDFMKPEYYKDAPHFHPVDDGPEYRLEIPSAKLDFTGTYSVIATNCHGQAKAIISLQIYAKDISKPMDKASIKHGNVETIPTFERRLQDMRCCDGDAITLECNVHAVPEPIIIWEKDGRVLSSTCKDFEMRYDGEKATLSILRVYPEDEGEYTCIAKNNIGRSFSSACVLVDVPEEKENMLSKQLHRPSGFLSTTSTPRSTPRATPIRNVSPLRLSYRATSIDLSTERRRFAAPKFYAIPNGRVVEEGDTVEFQCAIAGHPMPWATWDKDGMIVAQTSRIIIKERDDLRFLEIEDVNFDDAGLYRVTLENDFGRVEATARLDVIAKPRPDRSKSTRAVRSSSRSRSGFHMSRRIMGPSTQIGGRLALASAFRGSSVPSSKYYHNGDEVEESNRIHFEVIDNYTHSLIIDNVDKSDEGIYTCIAQNEDGIISTTTSVAFYDHNNDIPETEPIILKQLPKQIRTIEGQITDLSFEIESFEPYSYIWYRNDEMLLNNDEFRFIDHGNGILALRIMDTFDLDAGRYSCTVMTRNGSCSTYCDLIVEEDRLNYNDYDLEILKKPQPVLGFPGSIVSFCAKVYPPDAITNWSICGREISDDSREYSLESQSDGLRILHILGIEYYHSGEVKCTVIHPNNKLINLSAYTNLTILPSSLPNQNIFNFENTESNETPDLPVYITKGPDDCTALVGGTIVLKVHFGGKPIPKVYWFKAGHPVVESSNIKITSTDTNSILQITDITTDDSGKYTVEIMNDYSSDYAVASVAVESPPEPPSKPSISATYDRISIAWCGPPYDGGCVITGFIIEMQENSSEWIEIAHVVDSLAYTIKDVKPKVIYRFRVRAENIHGHSEPSKPSDETILQIPEIINENYDEIENRKKLLLLKQGGDFKQRFETLEELGKGRFGVVYKVIERETGQTMAAKVIKCIKARDRVKVQEEIAIMKSLEHPKLLQLAVSFETNREIIMIMEYITGGELFERVVADDFTLTERDCILFLRQICEGVDYMHSQSIVHLDLKPENIMCYTRTSHQIKIIDFGLAQRLNSDSPVRVLFGTPEFIAPEIINYEPISFQTDMWSVGVICYVLLSGLSPFMGDADVDTFANITRADYDFDDEAFDAISQEAKDFISNLLVHRKEDRLTAKECLESKWLSQYHDENLINKRICTDKLKKFIIRRKWQQMPQRQCKQKQQNIALNHYPYLVHHYHRCDQLRPYG
ncbi:myosin light chain kinase, smooth muscle isoform X2 [Condylostylus longicornis]|uniref:myosin light chain kinase, smooth muscle isoform X2 n=1 Tax=Condylostylus longicornis TaxID=2530218 RepID=UPI00244DD8A5|nr:myosin light chain kinase, smooth muscle isoform X2 [Condylostylus longicornis]